MTAALDHDPLTAASEAIPIRRSATDLGEFLRSTMAPMHQQAKAIDVSLVMTGLEALPSVMFLDRDKIAWAVTTLVGNALRHVRRGTRQHPGGTVTVRAGFDANTSEVSIEVGDDGVGISDGRIPLLFQGTPTQPPIGLALLLVRDVVGAHGGRIEVESSTEVVDHGTTFRLVLPVR